MKTKLYWGLLAFLILICPTHAQEVTNENETGSEEDDELFFELTLEQLLNIEVSSASKFSQKISEAPNIISAINREQIIKYGWLSSNDILYNQPGFSSGQDYDRRTVAFRGMFEGWNNNHLLMLVDGVPFNDNLYGTAFTSEVTPLIFTKSMEVIRGPGGSLYGTNAMNGVITLNTLNASDIKGNGQARLRFGSNETRVVDILAANENDNFGIVTSFSLYSTNGNNYESYDASGRVDGGGNLVKFETRDNRENTYFFSKIYGKKKLKGLSMQYHEQRWQFETGHGWLFNIPDEHENMSEFRRILALKYSPRNDLKNFNYEITTRYQKHGINWDMRYFPNNPGGDPANYEYPNGLTEYLKTDADDLFLRLQGDYNLGDSRILAGVEGTRFYYSGDKAHTSNAYLNGDFTAVVPNQFIEVGPWFGYVKDKPVINIGMFAQYVSPKFADKIQLTVSGRYDEQSFKYDDVYDNFIEKDKSFSLFTPRVSIVASVKENVTLKAIYGKAFRTPSPTEMFGTNTYSLGSNIDALKSEELTNIDLSVDWRINENFNLRVNGYNVKFENQIAYGGEFNISVNRNSPTTTGFEIESNFSFDRLSGFINYSYAQRTDEEIEDITISKHDDEVVWAPASTLKLGLNYNADKFYISVLAQQQGETLRRTSDLIDPTANALRPEKVDGWVNLDGKFNYKLNSNIDLGIIVNNLTDSEQMIIRNAANPFDYQRPGRSYLVDLIFKF